MSLFAPIDLDSTKQKRIPVYNPPSSTPKPFYVKSLDPNKPDKKFDPAAEIEKEKNRKNRSHGLAKWYMHYEGDTTETYMGKDGQPKKIRIYSIYPAISGYFRKVIQVLPSQTNSNISFANIKVLMQTESGEYFYVSTLLQSSFTDSLLINLHDNQVRWDQPIILSAYTKEAPDRTRAYMQYTFSQAHLPQRESGLRENFFLNVYRDIPKRTDRQTGKILKDWESTDWGDLLPHLPADIRSMPILDGLIESLNRKAEAALGAPPSEEAIVAELKSTEESSTGYEEDDEWGAYAAPSPQPSKPPMNLGSVAAAPPAPVSTTVEAPPQQAPDFASSFGGEEIPDVNSIQGVSKGLPMPPSFDNDKTRAIPKFVMECAKLGIDPVEFCKVFNQPNEKALIDAGLEQVANDHFDLLHLIETTNMSAIDEGWQKWGKAFAEGFKSTPLSFAPQQPNTLADAKDIFGIPF